MAGWMGRRLKRKGIYGYIYIYIYIYVIYIHTLIVDPLYCTAETNTTL